MKQNNDKTRSLEQMREENKVLKKLLREQKDRLEDQEVQEQVKKYIES